MKRFLTPLIIIIFLLIFISVDLSAQTSTTAFRFRRNSSEPNISGNGAEVYYDTVTNKFRFRDNSTWNDLDFSTLISGSGISSRVAFWNGINSLSSDSGFTFNSTNDDLTIGRDFILGRNITFPDGVRQIFNPNGTSAGLNIGSQSGDPSTLINGDIWYDSATNKFRCRENSLSIDCIGSGGGGSTLPVTDTQTIIKGSSDATKLLRFEIDGFTTATTRTLTPQNNNYIIAGTNIAQSFSLVQTFSVASGNAALFQTTDSNNNSAINVLKIHHSDIDLPGNGFGTNILFALDNNNNTEKSAGTTGIIWADANSGSEDSDFVVKLMTGGSAAIEKFRISSLGVATIDTLNATTYQTNGNTIYSSGIPSITGNATLNADSKDSAGKMISTDTGASTAVITFSIVFNNAPACFVTNETTSNLVRPVSTTTTLTINATVVTGDSISYQCLGY